MTARLSVALALASVVLLGAGTQRGPGAWTQVTPLPSPAPAGASVPGLVTDDGRGVLLSWIEPASGGESRFRVARLEGNTFGPAATIAAGSNFFVNWADVPAVFRAADRSLVAHWLERNPASRSAYDVRLAVSGDSGRTWAAAGVPHRDGTATEHGFVSFFDDPRGGVGLVWLDGRGMAGHGDSHAAGGGAAMSLRASRVMPAAPPAQIGDETVVDARVCDCCPTGAARTNDGVIVAYRDRTESEIRDIAVTRFDGRAWSAPAIVHADGWQINGCPVNGPAIAARDRHAAVAWYTQASGSAATHVAFSSDGGRTFGAPITLGDSSTLGRLAMAMPDTTGVLVASIERLGDDTALVVRHVGRDGRVQPPIRVASVSPARATGFPRLAVDGSRVIVAWTEVTAGRASGVRLAELRPRR